ncbi:O-antigen ligase family protein [Bradyrhizobium liaoningense]
MGKGFNAAESATFRLHNIGIRHLLLVAAIVVLIFSNDEKYAVAFQVSGVGLLLGSAVVCLLSGRTRGYELTGLDIIFLSMSGLSFLAGAVSQQEYIALYTPIFLVTYLGVLTIARSMSEAEIVSSILVSVYIISVIVFLAYIATMIEVLTPGSANRWALRLNPFNMHPNLTGFVYGGFITVLIFSFEFLRERGRYANLVAIFLCTAIILAASARAGLLALVVALTVWAMISALQGGLARRYFLAALSIGGVGTLLFWETVSTYLTEILELNSSTRGLDSGGSGRLELWQRGIDVLANRSWEVLTGTGLRSASEPILGFYTENSYITIALESESS